MKRVLTSLLLLVVVVATLVPFTNNASVKPAKAQDESLLIWADATRTPPLTALAAQFTEEYGIEVTVQEVALGEIRAQLPVAGAVGTGPDIIIAAHDWIGELVLNGAVVPINLGDKADLYTEASKKLFTYNGELYGVPYAVENVAFFRNPELVPDAPATWDDVRAITEEIVSSGAASYGFMMQDGDPYHSYPTISAFGGYVFGLDENGNYNPGDVGLDSEGALAAAAWMQEMAAAGYLVPEMNYDQIHTLFETAAAAMFITGPWALTRIRESGVPYVISDIPAGPGGPGAPFIGGQGFMISAFSENQLLAEAFLLDFMTAEEPMKTLYDADPRPPAFIPLLETLNDPDLLAFQQAGLAGVPQPSIPEMTSVWGAWGTALQLTIRQEQDGATAFSDAASQIRELIANSGVAPVEGETTGATGEIVGLPGTFQAQLGCANDWAPECENTLMIVGEDDGVWAASFELQPGDYEYKVALNGTWDENYGAGAIPGGDNIKFSLAEATTVTFLYDPISHWVTDSVNSLIVSAPGSYQAALGCPGDWAPDCLLSWLQDADADGIYEMTTDVLPAGDFEVKAAINQTWEVNYGADAARDGANIPFNVPADNTPVTFSFDSTTNVLTVTVGS